MIDAILALNLAHVLTTRSVETPAGHRVWTGDTKGTIRPRPGHQYTYRQAAHIIRTGYPAIGTVRTTCGIAACFLHITDSGTVPGPPTTPDPQWHQRAACRDRDMNLWYPEDHTDAATAQALAIGICVGCPVRAHCLADALAEEGGISDQGRHGIRGGLTGRQRQREYARRNHARRAVEPAEEPKPTPKPRQPAECGTRSGYQRHLREKTAICAPCRQANTDADNRLRRTGTTKAAA